METIMNRIQITKDKLIYSNEDETMTIDAWGKNSFRVRVTRRSEISDTAWALMPPQKTETILTQDENHVTFRNGKISVKIEDLLVHSGHLQFFRNENRKDIPIMGEYDYKVSAHNPGTRILKKQENELYHTELHLAPKDGERFYGMGANATGKLNLKGSVIDLYQRHVKAVVPFVVSSEGYGFLWNNPSLGRVEFGNNMTRWVSYGCKQIDYFITAGDSYDEIMEQYADATGYAPKFPYWASGFWQCKLRYETQKEFLDIARGFKERNLPISVLVIDFRHWAVLGDWKLDPKYWPDPKAMVKEMDDMGIRIMISPWTLVDEKSENYEYMKENNLFTTSIDGSHDTVHFEDQCYQYDPTNPEAAKYIWSKWKENYFDIGIKTFWLDPCDEFHKISEFDKVKFHIGPGVEAHSYFPVAHQKNIYEGQVSAGETEPVNICRNAWAGSQRYGACPAPHDIFSSFEHLEVYMKAALNMAMSGIPWYTVDIGGFVTVDNSSDKFHELMIRWYQYGIFNSVFRTHGCRDNNEPWTIGGNAYPHIRAAIFLRERMRPYIMKQMDLASEKGTPPVRPLFFDFAQDDVVYDVEDQFMFGPDIMVAPIYEYKKRSREVYLPSGTKWINAYTKECFDGNQTINVVAPIEYIPVFLKADKPRLLDIFDGLYEL